ncbi:MAG: 4-hydroxy-tetrahydrodipicolinate reductase [Planctomycetota bacterium]
MKITLIVNGAAGRMGRRIITIALESGQFDIIAAVEKHDHPDIGRDAGQLVGKDPINVKIDSTCPSDAGCLIDFSLPEAADAIIAHCLRNNIALVMCTTGLADEQIKKIKDAAHKIPVIRSANMSIGMNVLFSLAGKVADMLGDDYDIEIIESHHRFKKDAPSGSALTLAENIAKQTNRAWPGCLVHGRSGKNATRLKGTIGMHAVRAGDITGEHTVIYTALGERITLTHTAHSRDTFAVGALRAAAWLTGKEAGLYSMADVLGIK